MKFEKIMINISGIFLIINGFLSIFGYKSHMKFGGWVHISFEYSLYLIIGGILFIVFGNKYYSKRIKQKIEYSKCPKCKETYTYSTLEKGMCPKCDIKTIDIEKYFEKFPDEGK